MFLTKSSILQIVIIILYSSFVGPYFKSIIVINPLSCLSGINCAILLHKQECYIVWRYLFKNMQPAVEFCICDSVKGT